MVHETFNLAQMLLALQCPFGKLTFSDGVSCFASTCLAGLAGLAGLAPGCKEKMSQATWPSYKSWSFPMALRARRCPPEFLLFQDVLYWNDLRKELECFGCFQEFSKKGFPWFPPFRETKCHLANIWQTLASLQT